MFNICTCKIPVFKINEINWFWIYFTMKLLSKDWKFIFEQFRWNQQSITQNHYTALWGHPNLTDKAKAFTMQNFPFLPTQLNDIPLWTIDLLSSLTLWGDTSRWHTRGLSAVHKWSRGTATISSKTYSITTNLPLLQ